MTTIVITETARAQLDEVAAWWLENRPAAPELFENELAAALGVLTTVPRAGSLYAHPRAAGIRRLLLLRCRYHLYYSIEPETDGPGEIVTIVSLWHTRRGAGPALR